jgi:F0F1-type ATP synthase beta subunit
MANSIMQDDGTVMDPETLKTQKAYSNYEKEQENKQKERQAKDSSMVETARKVKEKVKSIMPFKSGGKVSSASKRADGCAQRGKTKGRMV